jgi:CheY-like chemotaxis protein
VIQSAVETSRPAIDAAGHQLSVSLPAEPVWIDADATRMAQVFSNLLNNASKYTDPGGRIELVAEVDGRGLRVTVRDNGIGISPEKLGQIFDMFVQIDPRLERAQGGLGIGLTLVRRLVELHGGTIEAQSDGPGLGSVFTVLLPVSTEAPAAPSSKGTEGRPAEPLRRRILVADDNEDSAESLAVMLRLMGSEVRTAHDGIRALEAAENFRPEVMVLDIGMPGMDGYEAARRVRGLPWGRAVVLIAVTGWGQAEDKRRAVEAGFDHHITKPVDAVELERLLAASQPAAS